MATIKGGNKRLMITLPVSLIDKLEQDTKERGLDITKSARIQLALEKDLNSTEHIETDGETK